MESFLMSTDVDDIKSTLMGVCKKLEFMRSQRPAEVNMWWRSPIPQDLPVRNYNSFSSLGKWFVRRDHHWAQYAGPFECRGDYFFHLSRKVEEPVDDVIDEDSDSSSDESDSSMESDDSAIEFNYQIPDNDQESEKNSDLDSVWSTESEADCNVETNSQALPKCAKQRRKRISCIGPKLKNRSRELILRIRLTRLLAAKCALLCFMNWTQEIPLGSDKTGPVAKLRFRKCRTDRRRLKRLNRSIQETLREVRVMHN
jgi:hypothetical protein